MEPPSYEKLLELYKIESLERRRLKADFVLFHKYITSVCRISLRIEFCVFCLVLNIATIVIYRLNQRRLMALGSGKEKENRMESRLTLYPIITFAAQFLLAIYTI
ncbi:hypothetical protein DdX_19172 [Ditylenchus destructor]|uniref:Uncharacterized protein n=1 Tax=Ditylenchus destructor TaxID=166010 RepID=A0AAD4QXM2_9BILA|nr:hypothetical protein DdX_19172 [Ditylenchus destructor]